MFISIRKYKTSDSAEVARRVNEQFLERVSKVPGFRGYYLVDIGDSNLASINLFDTLEGMQESNKLGPAWAKEAAAELLGPAEIHAGEVVAQLAKKE